MKVKCPNCGRMHEVNGMGRKKLARAGKIVYATLRVSSSITAVAEKLGVSRGWVNNWIKQQQAIRLMTRAEFLSKYMPKVRKMKGGLL